MIRGRGRAGVKQFHTHIIRIFPVFRRACLKKKPRPFTVHATESVQIFTRDRRYDHITKIVDPAIVFPFLLFPVYLRYTVYQGGHELTHNTALHVFLNYQFSGYTASKTAFIFFRAELKSLGGPDSIPFQGDFNGDNFTRTGRFR